jgi:rifampin ADP-ribosylating transferase
LQLALKINDPSVNGALPGLYSNIAKCYEDLNDHDNAKKNYELATSFTGNPSDNGPFYHGTKADLQVGDLLDSGSHVQLQVRSHNESYLFHSPCEWSGLAAALAKGDGRERVYIVEPTGSFENDPNVTDKKFPGNPTRSYRSQASIKNRW